MQNMQSLKQVLKKLLGRYTQGGKKPGSAGAGLPRIEDIARIVILAAKNIIGEKIFVRKLIYKM